MTNRIKEIRTQRGLSQAKLSWLSQLPSPTISQIETGKIHLYPAWRRRIALALGVREDELTAPTAGLSSPQSEQAGVGPGA